MGLKGAAASKKSTSSADPVKVREQVYREVHAAIVQVLGASIGDEEPLMSAGLDSLGSVEFANVLASTLGVAMPSTLVFDYPSVSAVTDFLALQMMRTAVKAVEEEGELSTVALECTQVAFQPWTPVGGVRSASEGVKPVVAVVSMATRQWKVDSGVVTADPRINDKIQRVPLARWDLDGVEGLLKDAFTLSAQVRLWVC
jgi:acyl carrier protein